MSKLKTIVWQKHSGDLQDHHYTIKGFPFFDTLISRKGNYYECYFNKPLKFNTLTLAKLYVEQTVSNACRDIIQYSVEWDEALDKKCRGAKIKLLTSMELFNLYRINPTVIMKVFSSDYVSYKSDEYYLYSTHSLPYSRYTYKMYCGATCNNDLSIAGRKVLIRHANRFLINLKRTYMKSIFIIINKINCGYEAMGNGINVYASLQAAKDSDYWKEFGSEDDYEIEEYKIEY